MDGPKLVLYIRCPSICWGWPFIAAGSSLLAVHHLAQLESLPVNCKLNKTVKFPGTIGKGATAETEKLSSRSFTEGRREKEKGNY